MDLSKDYNKIWILLNNLLGHKKITTLNIGQEMVFFCKFTIITNWGKAGGKQMKGSRLNENMQSLPRKE